MAATDVIIPAHNAEAWVLGAIRSTVHVPGLRRVHVVDDSSDRPLEDFFAVHAPSLGELAERVSVQRITRGGPGPARNAGVEAALTDGRVDALVFLDADDELTPGIAEALTLQRRTDAAAVCANSVFVYENGRERVLELPPGLADRPLPRPGAMFGVHAPVFRGTGLVVPRRVFDAGLRFDPRYPNSQDVDFIRRAGDRGPIVVSSPVGVRYRRRYAGNQTGLDRLATIVRCHLQLMDDHFEQPEERVWRDRCEHLLRSAARRWHDPALFDLLAGAMAQRGWTVPFTACARHAVARATGAYRRRARAVRSNGAEGSPPATLAGSWSRPSPSPL